MSKFQSQSGVVSLTTHYFSFVQILSVNLRHRRWNEGLTVCLSASFYHIWPDSESRASVVCTFNPVSAALLLPQSRPSTMEVPMGHGMRWGEEGKEKWCTPIIDHCWLITINSSLQENRRSEGCTPPFSHHTTLLWPMSDSAKPPTSDSTPSHPRKCCTPSQGSSTNVNTVATDMTT